MALFRGIREYLALDANNITLVFDSGNIVNISGNIFLYPPQGHPILYKYVIDSGQIFTCHRFYASYFNNGICLFQAELIATCETNIKCLQVINDTLDEEGNVMNVTDDDIQAVEGRFCHPEYYTKPTTVC